MFNVGVNSTETRTLYGDVVYENSVATGVKVNWVDGDMISVYGTNSLEGREQGRYKVVTGSETGVGAYAENLEMIGDHGVQWGSNPKKTSDFYAIYPSASDEPFTTNSGKVSVSASIRDEQKNVFTKSVDDNGVVTWAGTPYVDVTANNTTTKSKTMPDALMYAYRKGVANGTTPVDLSFKPFATVLKFKLDGWTSTGQLQDPTVYIQKITLTAPSGTKLVGDCTFTFSDGKPVLDNVSNASNTIIINPVIEGADFIPLNRNEKVEFSVFVIPPTGNTLVLNNSWSVTLESTHGKFKYAITPKANTTEAQLTLKAGQIHKINIPTLTVESRFTYETIDWIESIPRNVYLSELSVPGAWYCGESGYQNNTNLTDQYNAGIRAFHIDCRLSHVDLKEYNGKDDSDLKLVCAGTDKFENAGFTFVKGTLVSNRIQGIVEYLRQVESFKNEYIVIVLTIAEQAFKQTGINSGTYGTINPEKVLPAIASMLTTNGKAWGVYGYTDDTTGKTINANTTLNDVLGKIIVLVNTNNRKFTSYTSPSTLMAFSSMSSSDDSANNVEKGDFTIKNESEMYWGTSLTNPKLTLCYHFAQKTGTSTTNANPSNGVPTLKTRMNTIEEIIVQSQNMYYPSDGTKSLHNEWYEIGVGGYTGSGSSINYTNVAKTLNKHLYELIDKKLNGKTITYNNSSYKLEPSPVGIVMMNQATNDSYYGPELIQAIIDMNGKFRLNRDETQEEWPDANKIPSDKGLAGVGSWTTETL